MRKSSLLGGGGLVLAVALLAACGAESESQGQLHATKVVLERQVEGLRTLVARMGDGASVVSPDDVVVAIDQELVRDLILAQLPLEVAAGLYKVWLDEVEVTFEGSLLVTLRGGIALRMLPFLSGSVRLFGTLQDIRVDEASGTLRTSVAIDHLDLVRLAGLEQLISQGRRDELARRIRLQLDGRIPEISLPVEVSRSVDLPALSDGPIRIQGARLPLEVAVSEVLTGPGQLWVAIRVEPGEIEKIDESRAAEGEPGRRGPPSPLPRWGSPWGPASGRTPPSRSGFGPRSRPWRRSARRSRSSSAASCPTIRVFAACPSPTSASASPPAWRAS